VNEFKTNLVFFETKFLFYRIVCRIVVMIFMECHNTSHHLFHRDHLLLYLFTYLAWVVVFTSNDQASNYFSFENLLSTLGSRYRYKGVSLLVHYPCLIISSYWASLSVQSGPCPGLVIPTMYR